MREHAWVYRNGAAEKRYVGSPFIICYFLLFKCSQDSFIKCQVLPHIEREKVVSATR